MPVEVRGAPSAVTILPRIANVDHGESLDLSAIAVDARGYVLAAARTIRIVVPLSLMQNQRAASDRRDEGLDAEGRQVAIAVAVSPADEDRTIRMR